MRSLLLASLLAGGCTLILGDKGSPDGSLPADGGQPDLTGVTCAPLTGTGGKITPIDEIAGSWDGCHVIFVDHMGVTSAWDGSNWFTVATSGPPRNKYGLAWDSERQRVVMFGGYDSGTGARPGDVWEWDRVTWTQVAAAAAPGRESHGMAYDSARGRTVIFGGANGQLLNDTWEWDGTTMTMTRVAQTGAAPKARDTTAMAYDAADGLTVLFGGDTDPSTSTSMDNGETWTWDGSLWRPVNGAGPMARRIHRMSVEPGGKVILIGGYADATGYFDDTWRFDGMGWTRPVAGGGPQTEGFAVGFDEARQRTVVAGGFFAGTALDGTWEWDGSVWLKKQ